ncbi:PAS domain S-box protein [Caldichromatium japonicum]|uniref:histidine kinase n=1 Tax=Caldichromatium japonicum TaxID=2699430 RepID=A0A6G7VB24_9GAMM|nr:ATP-binding protein [Caldichromatium japonicum]QIK37273.1 PAS domain S-box protein [Caldichromatium japonicum]
MVFASPSCRPVHSPWPRRWLLSGLAVFLSADLTFAWQEAQDSYAVGGFSDALYHLGTLMMMTAAYLETRSQERAVLHPSARPWSWTLTVLPYLAIAAVYALVVATAFGWSPVHRSAAELHQTLVILILSGSLLTVLSMIRQAIAIGEAARLRTQQTIEQRERRFAALARYASDLVLLVDAELRPQFISQSCERILGWQSPAVDTISLFELIHPDDRQRAAQLLAKALSTQEIPLLAVWRMQRRTDGTWRHIEMLITNLSHSPDIGGLVLNGRDVTERQRYEQALERARAAAESANRARDAFLANMSHEIRTPMQAITGLIGLVLESPLAPQQRNYLERIQTASHSLLDLLNDILDYSKLEAGRMVLESVPLCIHTLLERTRSLFEIQAERKGLIFEIYIDPALPKWLTGDPLRLLQVLNNLVGNAIKFTHQGGVWVEVDCLEQTATAARLEFRVRDTGIGLDPDQVAHLFEAFQQADASITRQYGGSGLGLSICRRLVELMGGEIGVESLPGQGSTFWFRMVFKGVEPASAREDEERSLTAVPKVSPALASQATDPGSFAPGPDPASEALSLGDIQRPSPQQPTTPLDWSAFADQLDELDRLLAAHNSRARHLNRQLLSRLSGTSWEAAYTPIAQAIAILDFDGARRHLQGLFKFRPQHTKTSEL